MRLLAIAILATAAALLLTRFDATAAKPEPGLDQVDVARIQLVGFTAIHYSGSLGGIFGATEKCRGDFLGSRMCEYEEAVLSTTLPDATEEAWINTRALNAITSGGATLCLGWTSDSQDSSIPGGRVASRWSDYDLVV
jgi:hypothetical protein